MLRGALGRALTEAVVRPAKKPIWYAVHALTGKRIQITTRYLDGTMFAASFRASRTFCSFCVHCSSCTKREWSLETFGDATGWADLSISTIRAAVLLSWERARCPRR